VTSDALCHTTALTQELHLPPSPDHPPASPCDKAHRRSPPRQGTQHGCLFKAATHPAQDAFDRIDAQSRDWTELVRDHCSFTRPSSAPFRAPRACPPCPGRAAAPPYPALSWLASRLTSIAPGRCFSPISATDIPIRAPVPRPIPAPAACAAKSASAMSPEREPRAIQSAASDHLAAIQPRVELRLTARLQLRTNHLFPSLIQSMEEKSSARRQSLPGMALSAAPRAGDPTSDAPCRAPREPIAERPRRARTASTALASTRADSPIRGAFHRQVPPCRFRGGSPPPFPQLCSRGPASGALSPLSLLSQGKARSWRW
jgi:hypothetical protein